MKNNKKGFANYFALIIILGVLIVAGIAYYVGNNLSGILPNSFTIGVYANNSSSGAGRVYNGELTFVNGRLISGFQNYKVSQGSNCTTDCEKYTECIIKNKKWVDKTGSECKIEKFISLTKSGLEQQIKAKEIVQSDDFSNCHYKTCYRIK